MGKALTVLGYHGTSARSAEMILKIPGERAADRFVGFKWLGLFGRRHDNDVPGRGGARDP